MIERPVLNHPSLATMTGFEVNPKRVRDIGPDMLEAPGCPRIMPASYYHGTTIEERALVCNLNGIYLLPTEELVRWLKDRIAGRKAIEIGAGNGVLARAVGVLATDNLMQTWEKVAQDYARLQMTTVTYGVDVENLDAAEATRRYRPDVVVAAWVTHKFRPDREWAKGNQYGVNEENILRKCAQYIVIGNEQVHKDKSIWSQPHEIIYPDWLFSRAANGSRDFIAIFKGSL